MKYTGNYNLKKPEGSDIVNIEDLNDNADIIDQALKSHDDALATKETPAGAQAKADAAETNAKAYADNVGTAAITTANNYTDQEVTKIANNLASHKNDYVSQMAYAVASGTNSYSVSISGITALVEGLSIKIKFQNANTGTATLNINGLGAKEIRKSNGNALSAGNIKAGQICHLVYTGSVFQLLGEGGEYGTAQPEHVLEGYTIGTENGVVQGTMPNQGRKIITPSTTNIAIPQGYHDGTGYVEGSPNLKAENIKEGVNVFGIIGSYTERLKNPTMIRYETIQFDTTKSWSYGDVCHTVNVGKHEPVAVEFTHYGRQHNKGDGSWNTSTGRAFIRPPQTYTIVVGGVTVEMGINVLLSNYEQTGTYISKVRMREADGDFYIDFIIDASSTYLEWLRYSIYAY